MTFKKCACCGGETLKEGSRFSVCPVCGWEDDDIQNDDPDCEGGANTISLNEARRAFSAGKALGPLKRAAYQRLVNLLDEDETVVEIGQPMVAAVV